MAINKEWHAVHPMPGKPTKEQKFAWHVAHAAHCGCRKPPVAIQSYIDEQQRTRR